MLNRTTPPVYNISPSQEELWIQGSVLFAGLKKPTIVFTKVRKEKMVTANNAKFVDWLRDASITKIIPQSVLQSMRDGQSVTLRIFSKIKELIITVIRKGFWTRLESLEKPMGMQVPKPTEKEIGKKSNVTILSDWHSDLANLSNWIIARDVKTNVSHKLIIRTTQSLSKFYGFVVNVMGKSIGQIYQRERLNPLGAKAHVIVRPAQRKVLKLAEMTNSFYLRGNNAGSGIQQVARLTDRTSLNFT